MIKEEKPTEGQGPLLFIPGSEIEEQSKGLKLAEEVKLHKQPRSYLKSTARLVGKSTDEPTLFSLPSTEIIKVEEPHTGTALLREVISRNTAILGNYLLQLYQQSGQEDLVIHNLSPLAEMMNNTNKEVKIYLLYLGGYTYPIVTRGKDGGVTLASEQMFSIKFKYSKAVADKYRDNEDNAPLIGTSLSSFVRDEPVDRIIVKPNPAFIKALEGKGLGNVLVVNDKFVKLALSLTDIAFKIFSYSASNKPSQRIAEDNLIRHLGLDKQLKTQGRPRIRATILKGLQELQDRKHIKCYDFKETSLLYTFTYSDEYIRHKTLREIHE